MVQYQFPIDQLAIVIKHESRSIMLLSGTAIADHRRFGYLGGRCLGRSAELFFLIVQQDIIAKIPCILCVLRVLRIIERFLVVHRDFSQLLTGQDLSINELIFRRQNWSLCARSKRTQRGFRAIHSTAKTRQIQPVFCVRIVAVE